ncbi:MAG: malonyl-CoA synthase [Rhodospirillales bacterium]|jgi:malonyl-CoA/methylmalonyl-CoA synthetase|nr:malonyl-CoA synthase [Rhodospirillales bacterium]
MSNANLYALLASKFPADEKAVFLESPDGKVMRYGDLASGSGRMADLLRASGVEPGDRVVVQVEKSAEAVALYLACLRVGAIYIPLNTAYTSAELDYFVGDAKPRVLVCASHVLNELQGIAETHGVARVLSLGADGTGSLMSALVDTVVDDNVAQCAGSDIAAILYTSGTTGRSKGAMLSHDNLASNAVALHKMWGFVPGDVLLHALPIYHVHGLFVALHCALLNGSKVWFLPKFDIETVLALLPKSTVMMGVPTFYVRLLGDQRFDRSLSEHMRLFVAGSAPLLAETFSEFEDRTGQRILERYGMTEAGMITSNPYNSDNGARIAGSVGYPLHGVEARVCDDGGVELPRGEPGTLEIKGPNVFSGYWQNPEKTALEFRDDGFFITGDVSKMDEDGRISIVGRAKDLIISGGFNVYPKEIETEIDEIEGVVESAVIGIAHPDFGEGVVAVVVKQAGVMVEAADIIAALKGRLAKFKQPKKVFFVDNLPRNTMGKVQKKALREEYAGLFG